MDPQGRWGREHRMEPGPEVRSNEPGPDRRDPGYDYGPYNPSYEYPPYQRERQKPIDETQARRRAENYLDYTGNPNLKVGEIHEKDGAFEAEIVTKKEGSLVDKVIIDKRTGRMRFTY